MSHKICGRNLEQGPRKLVSVCRMCKHTRYAETDVQCGCHWVHAHEWMVDEKGQVVGVHGSTYRKPVGVIA